MGKKINVGEVTSRSADILRANPSIILTPLLHALPSLVGDFTTKSSIFDPITIIATILSAILSVIASGHTRRS